MSYIPTAEVGARIRKLAITNTASNIFAAAVGPPVVPYTLNKRGVSTILIQNNSGNDWYYGFSSAVTVPAGALPGILIPKSFGQVSIGVSAAILQTLGLWIISTAGGPDEGVVAEFI